MRLSKVQQDIMDSSMEKIAFARTHSIDEWALRALYRTESMEECIQMYIATYGYSRDEAVKRVKKDTAKYIDDFKGFYDREKQGIVLTRCSGRTLKRLESLGLIEILRDATHIDGGIDVIKVLKK